MLFAILAAVGSGLAIGLRFRVNMLLAASSVFVIGTVAAAIHSGWSLGRTIVVLLVLLGLQQGAYLVGLYLASRNTKPLSVRRQDADPRAAGSARGAADSVKKL